MGRKVATICFIINDFPFSGLKICILISITFQDLYAPCNTSEETSLSTRESRHRKLIKSGVNIATLVLQPTVTGGPHMLDKY